jgi:hypothetical protein
MIPLFQYLLKVILVSGILTGYYWVSLRNKRFHHYNRFYLVGTLLLSWGLPLLNLQWFYLAPEPASPIHQVAKLIYFSPNTLNASTMSWDELVGVALIVVAGILVIAFLRGIAQLFLIKSKGRVTPMDRFDFIETSVEDAPFSFFRNLFWKKECALNDENGQRMLHHEITHIEQYHSFDKVLATLSTCLAWMNPFFWLIRKELEVVHEFIADEAAITNNDASQLAEMLLAAQFSPTLFSNGQSFFYSSIKRRILMLTASKKTSYSYARRLLVLPITLGALALLSFTIRNKQSETKQFLSITGTSPAIFLDTIPAQFRDLTTGKLKGNYQIEIQDDTAIFKDPKSKKNLFKVPLNQLGAMAGNSSANKSENSDTKKRAYFFSGDSVTIIRGKLINNQKAPRIVVNGRELSSSNELQLIPSSDIKTIDIRGGEVNIKVDSSTGDNKNLQLKKVADKSTVTIEGIEIENLSIEKIKEAHERLKDGKTDSEYLIAIGEKKEGDGKVVYAYSLKADGKNELPKDILYIIDGQESDAAAMKKLGPNSIKSINVLKGNSANNKYGDKGKNGVIEIITKK